MGTINFTKHDFHPRLTIGLMQKGLKNQEGRMVQTHCKVVPRRKYFKSDSVSLKGQPTPESSPFKF